MEAGGLMAMIRWLDGRRALPSAGPFPESPPGYLEQLPRVTFADGVHDRARALPEAG